MGGSPPLPALAVGFERGYARTLRADGITVNAVSPGYVATDLNYHGGRLTAEEAGAHIARQATRLDTDATGVFLSENGGTYCW
jgi:NAD(P)-dependent dehydrogenase (short-subunit alcohol dehydrogenase family)